MSSPPSPSSSSSETIEVLEKASPNQLKHAAAIEAIISPPDSYASNGQYWADLPGSERRRWANEQFSEETKQEAKMIAQIARHSPFAPISHYFSTYAVKGLGLFVEGGVLFSIGNLDSMFARVWPECWGPNPTVCTKNSISAITYLEIIGIIIGQIVVGIESDYIGRRWGLIQDAALLLLGTLMLIAAWGTSLQGWVAFYAVSLFVYSLGVGGEYPLTGASTIENVANTAIAQKNDKLHRGRSVLLAFMYQGYGTLANQVILVILLVIFNGTKTEISKTAAQGVYRISFAIAAIFTAWLLYFRATNRKIRASDSALKQTKKRGKISGYDMPSLKLAFSHYGGRLLCASGAWFANDVFFYGNKLFQSAFISVIIPDATLLDIWCYNLLNIAVSLVGYNAAAVLIDYKLVGRNRLQQFGFLACFICFVIPTFAYNKMTQPGAPIRAFQALYYLSSFFNQCGPNSTTFIAAAETFPTSIRGTTHGFSAAIGKLGALLPAIVFGYVGPRTRFLIVIWFALVGMILTMMFSPDVTGLSLVEQERYWQFVLSGREKDYHGIAIHPRHLSWWEHRILGRSKQYDPVKDRQMRLEELKALAKLSLEVKAQARAAGQDSDLEDNPVVPDEIITEEVIEYFGLDEKSSGMAKAAGSAIKKLE